MRKSSRSLKKIVMSKIEMMETMSMHSGERLASEVSGTCMIDGCHGTFAQSLLKVVGALTNLSGSLKKPCVTGATATTEATADTA